MNRPSRKRILPIALFAAAVLTILMGGVLRFVLPGAFDPWWARLTVAAACLGLAIVFGHRKVPTIYQNLGLQGLAYVALAWVGMLLWGNAFPASGSSGILVVQAAGLASFPQVRWGALYVVCFTVMVMVAGAWVPEPEVHPFGLAATSASVGALVLAAHAQRATLSRALRRSRDALEAEVQARTADLEAEVQERRRAEERALRASDAKSRFLANMSHELRTPLNAILGYAELVREESASEAAHEDLQRIIGSGQHLLHLVNDVLDLARIEAGAIQLFPEPIALHDILRSVADNLTPHAVATGNQLVVEAPIGLAIETDRQRLAQILLNLVSNAVKFTEAGQIVLRASRRGSAIAIEVQDQGIGIPAEALPTLFERFTQVDDSFTRTRGGTGLGLALSRDLARRMGGELTARSVAGAGSTFTLLLPPTLADVPQDTPL